MLIRNILTRIKRSKGGVKIASKRDIIGSVKKETREKPKYLTGIGDKFYE